MTTYLDIVIAGGGRVGLQTAKLLDNWDHNITIVERDPGVCDAISDEYVATVIQGDASNPDILRQAKVEDSDVIAGLTGGTGLNLAVCMEAKQMSPDIRSVARIDNSEQEAYTQFVDGIIFPELAGARVAANEIMGHDVRTLSDVTGDLDIMQIKVRENAPAAEKELRNVRFPTGALVISDDDGHRIAGPKTTLTPGKSYVVAVEPDVADEVMNLMRGT
ncbi:MAG: TrkA family potassium uptake protein [Halobacteria archaeon]|nr:TrkA family potassium uptake protein [Halobacteria archaeon]